MTSVACRGLLLLMAATLAMVGDTAQALMIDDFSTAQTLTVVTPGTSATDETSGAGIAGGERDMEVTRSTGVGITMIATTGSLSYGHIAGSEGTGRIIWDGIDGDPLLNPTGLGGLDFTDGGASDAFGLSILLNDFAAPLTLIAYSDAANFSTATVLLPGNIPPDPLEILTILFTDFVPTGSGADFANIGALELLIDGSAVSALDLELGFIQTLGTIPVPEPSTSVLLLGGLLGIACTKRRRRSLRNAARAAPIATG